MPLDPTAHQYAAELFNREQEQIADDYQSSIRRLANAEAAKGQLLSGNYFSKVADALATQISRVTTAKVQSLRAAYERAKIPTTQMVLDEIAEEIEQFSKTQERNGLQHMDQIFAQRHASGIPGLQASIHAKVTTAVNRVLAREQRELRIVGLEIKLDEQHDRKVYAAALGKEWDVFISHASEDKPDFVRPLAEALKATGLRVWYDEDILTVGDSLSRSIDFGLARSQFGVVVLSHHFFAKSWPRHELGGLWAKQIQGVKVILPVWHGLTKDDLLTYSPMLTDFKAADSKNGLQSVVNDLRAGMGLTL
jgi:hypothetical protein